MSYQDDFSDPPRRGFLGLLDAVGPKAGFFIALIVLSFLVGVVWNLYSSGGGNRSDDTIPTVRADNKPFKVIPDDQGGQHIAHRDSTVFSSLRGESADGNGRVENLFDDAENEEPLPRSQLFAGLSTETDEGESQSAIDSKVEVKLSPLDRPLGAAKSAVEEEKITKSVVEGEAEELVQEALNALPTISVKPKPKPKAIPKVSQAPKKETNKPAPDSLNSIVALSAGTDNKPIAGSPSLSSSGNYYVQLGSVKSAASAAAEWKKFNKKYAVLAGLSHRVETADLGAKGVYHRIQAGPLSKDRARAVCGEIKKVTPGGCLVTKR